METRFLDIEKARLLVSHGTKLRAAVIRARRGKECAALLCKSVQSDGKNFVEFYELKLANEPKARIFRSLDAAANAILTGIGLTMFTVTNMTPDEFKELVLKNDGAEERR